MDTEEPEAALVISISLNKKNEAAMTTGHTEIMHTLGALCKPDPHDLCTVLFEPVRDKMVELYGCQVDHHDFHHAFRLVMDAGGADSVHMKDLHDFTAVHVNPRVRKLRFETYAVVAPLDQAFPRLKNSLLKWTWKQPPIRGWCPLPPSILHRLDPLSKFKMITAVAALEEAMIAASECIQVVAKDEKSRVKFIAEVDIGLVSKLIAVPRVEQHKTVSEQEAALVETCGCFLAVKLNELLVGASRDFEYLLKDKKRFRHNQTAVSSRVCSGSCQTTTSFGRW